MVNDSDRFAVKEEEAVRRWMMMMAAACHKRLKGSDGGWEKN